MKSANRVFWGFEVFAVAGLGLLAGLPFTTWAQDDGASTPAPSSDESASSTASSGESNSGDSSSSDSGASGSSGGFFSGISFGIAGFLRSETAFSTGAENPYNQRGNPYNFKTVNRLPGVPTPGVEATNFVVPNPVLASTAQRPVRGATNLFNLHVFRGEADANVQITSDLRFEARLRTIAEIGHYETFNGRDLDGSNEGGITGNTNPSVYGGSPNYFQYRVEGNKHPNPLEINGPNYQAYFPVFIFDYNHGPINVRLGNQQIAWGQALFFRVLDVPDGLDLRRHLIFGKATEEFSDIRIPSPALRVGYQFTDELLADAYVQKFQPTIYPNPETQYNVIPVQFTVHDNYNNYYDKISYGLRLKGNYGQYGFQAIAVRRYNPDGFFRWTQSGVNKPLSNVSFQTGLPNPLGITENTLHPTGPLLAQTPFEASPGGVYSADEFCGYGALVKLDCFNGTNKAITDFEPATGALLAGPTDTFQANHNQLDTFFTAAGGSLHGHIKRDYAVENVFGLGGSYVTEAEPGSILDQIVINLESSYIPNRKYTPYDLGQRIIEHDEWLTALVMEKYQRFTSAFPATYMVFQAMHRTHSDLFGRDLRGYNGSETKAPTGVGKGGVGANYVVLAAVQPFPQSIYEAYFASLADIRGGILFQPGLRWKPNTEFTVEGFYTYINGHIGDPNKNTISSVDFADEFTLRLTYQF